MKKTFFFVGVALGVAFSAGWLLSPTKVEIEKVYCSDEIVIPDGTEQLRELICCLETDTLGRNIPQEIVVLCNNLYMKNPSKETLRDWFSMPEFRAFISEYTDIFCGFEFLIGINEEVWNRFTVEFFDLCEEYGV